MQRVGVVGFGLMGAGIAEVCARAGLDVVVVESNEAAAGAGLIRVEKSLARAESRGTIESARVALDRLQVGVELDALADRELVIEAIAEDEPAKVEMFRTLDDVVADPDAILASNTSSIPIVKLGAATSRPHQVIGIHFFNPVPVLALVELVPSLMTSKEVTERARSFVEVMLGKSTIDSPECVSLVIPPTTRTASVIAAIDQNQMRSHRRSVSESCTRQSSRIVGPLARVGRMRLQRAQRR